jgi:repressor LexA
MKQPTARQLAYLRIIAQDVRDRGYGPSFRELGAALGVGSTNGVSEVVHRLIKRGYLTRDRGSRTLRVTPAGYEAAGELAPCKLPVTVFLPVRCVCGNDTFADDKLCPGCRSGRDGFALTQRAPQQASACWGGAVEVCS